MSSLASPLAACTIFSMRNERVQMPQIRTNHLAESARSEDRQHAWVRARLIRQPRPGIQLVNRELNASLEHHRWHGTFWCVGAGKVGGVIYNSTARCHYVGIYIAGVRSSLTTCRLTWRLKVSTHLPNTKSCGKNLLHSSRVRICNAPYFLRFFANYILHIGPLNRGETHYATFLYVVVEKRIKSFHVFTVLHLVHVVLSKKYS